MVDVDTHRIIDLLPSRETKDVTDWLKSYPNISVISCDGSVSYHAAINQVSKTIQQVSDRFHLVKGCTDVAKTFLTRFFSTNVVLPIETFHYSNTETITYWDKPIQEDLPTIKHNANLKKKQEIVEKVCQ